eukprot:4924844-Amphidinium_carterae.1
MGFTPYQLRLDRYLNPGLCVRVAMQLVESASQGFSGNFAQGLALAAAEIGTQATLVMPDDAPQPKASQMAK